MLLLRTRYITSFKACRFYFFGQLWWCQLSCDVLILPLITSQNSGLDYWIAITTGCMLWFLNRAKCTAGSVTPEHRLTDRNRVKMSSCSDTGPKPHYHFELAECAASTGAETFWVPHRPSFHGPMIGFVALRVTLFWPWSNPASGQAFGILARIRTTVSGVLLMLIEPWSNFRTSDSSIAPLNNSQA